MLFFSEFRVDYVVYMFLLALSNLVYVVYMWYTCVVYGANCVLDLCNPLSVDLVVSGASEGERGSKKCRSEQKARAKATVLQVPARLDNSTRQKRHQFGKLCAANLKHYPS